MIQIPLGTEPDQVFDVDISGSTYRVRVVLNSRSNIWNLSLSQAGQKLIDSVSLVGGVDLFIQYPSIPITNAYILNVYNQELDPIGEEFGDAVRFLVLDSEDLSNV